MLIYDARQKGRDIHLFVVRVANVAPPPFSLTILIETPSSQNTVIVSMARKCDQRERLCHETEGCHVNRVKEMCYHFHVMAEVSQVLLSFVLVVDRFLAHIVQRKTD